MNAPNEAGAPIVSASVAGTEPPTEASASVQTALAVLVGSLSETALSVTVPAPVPFSM